MTTATAAIAPAMRQRADLTYKQNVQHGRHGWLRLTPAYSVRLVEQVLSEFGADASSVFEPFSGTGTTPLCAAYRGLRALATDINPFLIWLGRVKAAHYTEQQCRETAKFATQIATRVRKGKARTCQLPPLKNIERWWAPDELELVASLRAEVEAAPEGAVRDLLKVAFCRTMIASSNAAFNHQSMSFKDQDTRQIPLALDETSAKVLDRFLADVSVVSSTAADNPTGPIRIEQTDARGAGPLDIGEGSFDLLITSPPYPNRMSYIRELRPYMYWLGFLEDAKSAGELDWKAIGGTWGIATSRLLTWKPTGAFVPGYLFPTLDRIRESHPKNGELMAQYVHKYCDDMFQHFQAAATILKPGGTAHYIVGNSTFYGHNVPAERIYCDQLRAAGFKQAEARALRKRNSKKELVEYHVIAVR